MNKKSHLLSYSFMVYLSSIGVLVMAELVSVYEIVLDLMLTSLVWFEPCPYYILLDLSNKTTQSSITA